jgi:lysozyme
MTKNKRAVTGIVVAAIILIMLRKQIATALNKTPFGTISDKIFNVISSFEGFDQVAVPDVTGYAVGYGSHYNWDAQRNVQKGDVIDKATAKQWLLNDAQKDYSFVQSIVQVPINDNQLLALSSFSYNVGRGNLQNSTLLKMLNGGIDKTLVANEFDKWVYSAGVKSDGLKKRRQAEKQLFLTY